MEQPTSLEKVKLEIYIYIKLGLNNTSFQRITTQVPTEGSRLEGSPSITKYMFINVSAITLVGAGWVIGEIHQL